MDEFELNKKVEELVQLTIQRKELNLKVKNLRADILDYAKQNNINDKAWSVDNGHVEVMTNTKYKLVDIPSEFKIPHEIAATDIAQKAFKSKISLSKEGKKMFKDQSPFITKLMIPSLKTSLKIIV